MNRLFHRHLDISVENGSTRHSARELGVLRLGRCDCVPTRQPEGYSAEVEIYAVTLQHETAASENSVGYDAEGGNGEFARGACERSSLVIACRPPRDAATGDHEGDGGEGVRFRWVPRQKFLENGENIGGIMAAMVRAGDGNEVANPVR